jgi:hypothetical protein
MLRGQFEGFDAVCGLKHIVAVAPENFPGQLPNSCFVVRNQNREAIRISGILCAAGSLRHWLIVQTAHVKLPAERAE